MKKFACAVVVASVALVNCGGSSGPADWKDAKLKTFEGSIKGINFSIELPEGMKGKDDSYAYSFDYRVGGRVYTPDISISSTSAKTLDEAVKQDAAEAIFDKESNANGYSYAYENSSYKGREDYIVNVVQIVGDNAIKCHARITPMSKGGTTKDRIPLIKKFCASLKIKP